MTFDPFLADIRFGCGRAPDIVAPRDMGDILTRLNGPDTAASAFPVPGFDYMGKVIADVAERRRAIRRAAPGADRAALREAESKARMADRKRLGGEHMQWMWNVLMRRAHTHDGFRERLTSFWADHFAAAGKNIYFAFAVTPSIEDTIRPRITGRFADLLGAVVTQPLMLHYLDQSASRGPNSPRAKDGDGLNENLARELMELHTLGVGGPYTQTDVRELAELLTGLSFAPGRGFVFRPVFAEPGAETVLGKRYGGGPARLEDILEVVEDLARHPVTARHIAGKLAVHFVSDTPDPDLVDHMTAQYIASDGDLNVVYAAMLEHPAAWRTEPGNVKQPLDFIGSTLRALMIGPDHPIVGRRGKMQALFRTPLDLMGQPWERPAGPDGWPESDAAWITPQRLAARLRWAWAAPSALAGQLPDPRDLLDVTVGPRADADLRFAVSAAADRTEGVALVLTSPAFQRM